MVNRQGSTVTRVSHMGLTILVMATCTDNSHPCIIRVIRRQRSMLNLPTNQLLRSMLPIQQPRLRPCRSGSRLRHPMVKSTITTREQGKLSGKSPWACLNEVWLVCSLLPRLLHPLSVFGCNSAFPSCGDVVSSSCCT